MLYLYYDKNQIRYGYVCKINQRLKFAYISLVKISLEENVY